MDSLPIVRFYMGCSAEDILRLLEEADSLLYVIQSFSKGFLLGSRCNGLENAFVLNGVSTEARDGIHRDIGGVLGVTPQALLRYQGEVATNASLDSLMGIRNQIGRNVASYMTVELDGEEEFLYGCNPVGNRQASNPCLSHMDFFELTKE